MLYFRLTLPTKPADVPMRIETAVKPLQKPIDEDALTKGQRRKLNALRKSVGDEIGERAFAAWLTSQGEVAKGDKNIETIESALWQLVQEGQLRIRRGGYLVRRGRGRLIVESPGRGDDATSGAEVTEAMNRVCDALGGNRDAFVSAAAHRVLAQVEW